MVTFNRDTAHESNSWAYKAFLDYLTDINRNYWSLVPALSKEKYLANLEAKDGNELNKISSVDFFKATGENSRRIPPNLEEWLISVKQFENWNRINILISLVSNFETYLSLVTRIALESNPALLFNYTYLSPSEDSPDRLFNKIDGVEFLKKNLFNKKGYKDLISSIDSEITHGDWTKRTNMFYKIFPDAPEILRQSIADLEKTRKLRNNAAHSFGREITQARENRDFNKVASYDRLSEKRLINYFKLFSDLSLNIDNYLLKNHIGAYEIVYYYHKNYVEKNNLDDYCGNMMVELKKDLTSRSGTTTWGKAYLKEMIQYYHSI
ncbi:TPA: hypothetical protein TZS81_001265 [Streptococcus suis]|nr:hypothetical protein [Streptococcus suis]HEL2396152.1 hypothetical protein [Streptococcus suis]HEL9617857.1 hypothetical protein [Streptococcus suis]HEL9649033.1 hypothetical protein [Streptococcus suis]